MTRMLTMLSLNAVLLTVLTSKGYPDDVSSSPSARVAELEQKLFLLSQQVEEQAAALLRQQSEIAALREAMGLRGPAQPFSVQRTDLDDEPEVEPAHTLTEPLPAPTEPTADWTSDHAFLRSSDGNFKIEFGGRALLDYRAYPGDAAPPDTFAFRRARLKVEGQLFEHYEYEVETELTDSETPLRDGYLNINYHRGVQFKMGQFKIPFSQEELISTKYLEFIENASVNAVVPGRSPGFQVHGELFDGAIQYQTGAFTGLGKLSTSTGGTPEIYARTRFTPFGNNAHLSNLSFGGAYGRGRHVGGLSVEGRTASYSTTFFEPVPINGRVERVNTELAWLHRNWSIRGEYDRSLQAREGLGTSGSDLPAVVGRGLILQGTYTLTGETKIEHGIIPNRPFMSAGGIGAWELAFRYESLRIDDSLNPNRHQAYTFGVNWWLTRFVRFSSNFIVELFNDPERAARPGEKSSKAFLSRMQVIF